MGINLDKPPVRCFMSRSKSSYSLLMPALATTFILILSGCQKYGQQPARVTKASPTVDPNSKASDGYTPEQKTYFTDIQKLKAYATHLAPIFQNLGPAWTASVQMKKWLFVPQDINADDTRNMAVHFVDGADKALAVQTTQDIRVQRVLFGAVSVEEQADILLTEVLTSAYLLKNLNDTDLCALVQSYQKGVACSFVKPVKTDASEIEESEPISNDEGDIEIQEAANRRNWKNNVQTLTTSVNDPRFGKKIPLSPTDYHRIKLLATFLTENTKDLDQKKVLTKMTELGFDTRIFQVQFAK